MRLWIKGEGRVHGGQIRETRGVPGDMVGATSVG
jgi:hypothetical protein